VTKRIITPPGWRSPALLSHAIIKSGTPVFIAGQVGTDPDGKLAGDGGPVAQVEQAFANLSAVVQACGATMDDVTKLTIYATDRDLREPVAAARRRHFVEGERPATTFLVVAGLAAPELLVEVEAVAVIDHV